MIYFQAGSAAAEAEAARLAAQWGPLTVRAGTAQADAVPHLLSVLYFHPEDAAAVQELAAVLGRPAAALRVWAMRPPGAFEVWLPDPSRWPGAGGGPPDAGGAG